MKKEEIKIVVPEGYEIDKENSTFECIKLKPKELYKPKSWEEFVDKSTGQTEYHYSVLSAGRPGCVGEGYPYQFKTREEAYAFTALGKLIQLRDAWWGDWRPDWCDTNETKYIVYVSDNGIARSTAYSVNEVLAFPTAKMRDDFYNAFEDLIEEAKMFL